VIDFDVCPSILSLPTVTTAMLFVLAEPDSSLTTILRPAKYALALVSVAVTADVALIPTISSAYVAVYDAVTDVYPGPPCAARSTP
jgi:hypothetical protein